jgi:succinate dehydrogenase / fumarate reductase iron-sulfur subunit
MIHVKIFRYTPGIDKEPRFQSYKIPYQPGMSAHNLLQYIYHHIDNTLGFRNYNCFLGVCTTCLVRINGMNARACTTPIKPGDEITFEPARGFKIIRDLAVDFAQKTTKGMPLEKTRQTKT